MDCEKYEPLLLDELYEELDEVTSAAVKRHVSGCARCGGILNGLRATRRAVTLPLVAVPAGLEDRILASVKEAQKVVPIQSRFQRALSVAGSWAMRPQTAMAAVFLLMIGSSAFVIRSRHGDAARAVSVTEQGAPAATASPAEEKDSLDSNAAAAAHGAHAPSTLPPPSPAATALASGAVAVNEPAPAATAGPMDGITGGKGRVAKDDEGSAFGDALSVAGGTRSATGTKEEAQAREKKAAPRTADRDIGNAAAPAGAPETDYAPRGQSVAPPAAAKAAAQDPQDGFSAGMAAYRARNFVEATRQFDAAARSGDMNAALWAAKSVKDGNGGCTSAVPRFDSVAQRASGSWLAGEAQLEAARCQIALGNLENARERLTRLQSDGAHGAQAQQALTELNHVAQRRDEERKRSAGAAGGGGAAARPAAPAPARAPAKPSAPAADRANGF